MSTSTVVHLYCDKCHASCSAENRCETARETRKYAKEIDGFGRVRVENGSLWDMCATCLRAHHINKETQAVKTTHRTNRT